MTDPLAYRLALAQLPVYRQIYSADFTIMDSYRIAQLLLATEAQDKKSALYKRLHSLRARRKKRA